MKKIVMAAATLLGISCLGAFEVPAFGLDTRVKLSTEHVVRGREQGHKVFAPRAEVNLSVLEKAKVYVGTYAFLGLDGDVHPNTKFPATRNEVNPYLGASYEITEIFTVDGGYIHHFFTNMPTVLDKPNGKEGESFAFEPGVSPFKRNTSEIYVGLLGDVLLSPSLYLFYDFGCREIAIEGRVAYTYDLGQFGVGNVAVELGAKVGYDKAKRYFASNASVGSQGGKKDYFYYGLNADLVYGLNEHAKARAGVEFAGNNASKDTWVNSVAGGGSARKNFVWFNASVDCSF
ncbi:MAG: hypothetical protein LBJ94_03090 [Puniceicoccales bacterium]|nr:hypothetical protein [Puniceicoccales bacterium]